jgi:hypothetical protein
MEGNLINSIEFYNVMGQLLFRNENINNSEINLDVQKYKGQVIMVKIKDMNNNLHMKKIVVAK